MGLLEDFEKFEAKQRKEESSTPLIDSFLSGESTGPSTQVALENAYVSKGAEWKAGFFDDEQKKLDAYAKDLGIPQENIVKITGKYFYQNPEDNKLYRLKDPSFISQMNRLGIDITVNAPPVAGAAIGGALAAPTLNPAAIAGGQAIGAMAGQSLVQAAGNVLGEGESISDVSKHVAWEGFMDLAGGTLFGMVGKGLNRAGRFMSKEQKALHSMGFTEFDVPDIDVSALQRRKELADFHSVDISLPEAVGSEDMAATLQSMRSSARAPQRQQLADWYKSREGQLQRAIIKYIDTRGVDTEFENAVGPRLAETIESAYKAATDEISAKNTQLYNKAFFDENGAIRLFDTSNVVGYVDSLIEDTVNGSKKQALQKVRKLLVKKRLYPNQNKEVESTILTYKQLNDAKKDIDKIAHWEADGVTKRRDKNLTHDIRSVWSALRNEATYLNKEYETALESAAERFEAFNRKWKVSLLNNIKKMSPGELMNATDVLFNENTSPIGIQTAKKYIQGAPGGKTVWNDAIKDYQNRMYQRAVRSATTTNGTVENLAGKLYKEMILNSGKMQSAMNGAQFQAYQSFIELLQPIAKYGQTPKGGALDIAKKRGFASVTIRLFDFLGIPRRISDYMQTQQGLNNQAKLIDAMLNSKTFASDIISLRKQLASERDITNYFVRFGGLLSAVANGEYALDGQRVNLSPLEQRKIYGTRRSTYGMEEM